MADPGRLWVFAARALSPGTSDDLATRTGLGPRAVHAALVGGEGLEPRTAAVRRAFQDDGAALRGHLVDESSVSREDGVYWRTGGSVDL